MERFALSRRPLAHVVETWECTNDEKKPKGGTMHPKSKDITLLLIYLTGWEEESGKEPGGKFVRTWRGYDFEILNQLERERLILQYANSVVLTPEGKAKARGLKYKYITRTSMSEDLQP